MDGSRDDRARGRAGTHTPPRSRAAAVATLVAFALLVWGASCAGSGDPRATGTFPGTAGGTTAGTAAGATTLGTTSPGTQPGASGGTGESEDGEEIEGVEGLVPDSDGNLAEPDPAVPHPAATAVTLPKAPAPADPTYAWTQLAPGGRTQVRAVVDGACPPATVDGRAATMAVFAAPTAAFPYTTCQLELATPATTIDLGGRAMPAMPQTLDRIVVVGDIGCYVKKSKQQHCLDPDKFPAAKVAAQIAAADPDLVLFVGDIYYTEVPCPQSASAKCAGVPYGDNWGSWAYNFFTPYAPALSAAPWVFARGNHEQCSGKSDNGGAGWFQLLAVAASACQDIVAPYRVDVVDQSYIVFDSSLAGDNPVVEAQVAPYTSAFQTVHQLAQGRANVWFMDHRPLWAARGTKSSDTLNLTLQAAIHAAGNTLPTDVSLVLSGHVHALGVYTLADGRPAQILSGGGGVKLTGKGGDFKGTAIDGTTFTRADVQTSWGYVQFDRTAPGQQSWNVTYRELGGSTWKSCSFATRTLSC